jgi:hypothetical protein
LVLVFLVGILGVRQNFFLYGSSKLKHIII